MASGLPLSYLGNVNIAVRIVREEYPDAQLFVIESQTPDGNPTEDPRDLTRLRGIFNARGTEGGTVFINQDTWGEWSQPTYSKDPWGECEPIPWPIHFELNDAVKVFREGGYTQFNFVTLRWPLGPAGRYKEPYYIFGLPDGSTVDVGVYSHKIVPQ
ncbi:hypothetical protein L218DRAFT_579395 [Marasmius fiardii PR-910]|nr:hypothetical protein L218DRAFT_579395 [Marasmius fiardii PR-910]